MTFTPRSGFSLIELLITMLILGVLAAIAVLRYWASVNGAHASVVMADLRHLSHLQEVHHTDHLVYTESLEELSLLPNDGVTVEITEATGSGWAAVGTHSAVSGEQCGIYTGAAAPANGDPASQPGVVMCSF